jgi:glycerol uptake facilitator-like aquaporin
MSPLTRAVLQLIGAFAFMFILVRMWYREYQRAENAE